MERKVIYTLFFLVGIFCITTVNNVFAIGELTGSEIRNSTYTGSILFVDGDGTFDLVVRYIEKNNPTNTEDLTWDNVSSINYTFALLPTVDYYIAVYYNPTFVYTIGGTPELGTATIENGYPVTLSFLSHHSPFITDEDVDIGIGVIASDGGIFGLPIVFIFIIALASVFTGRSSPMGIIFVAVAIGVMAYMGMIDFNFDPANQSNLATWAIIIIAVIIGVFIGKRWD